jgi:outer membrane receptor protein involved in Fe transport
MTAAANVSAQARSRIALAVSLVISGAAFAQAPQDEAGIAEVIVTGTRIVSPNMTSTSPILSVTSEEMRSGGRADVSDMLNMLPQINSNSQGQDLGNRTSGLNSAGGVATANLRGLGANRTLVLVDGRRLGTGSPQTVISSPAPDIDQIPTALIERVEVVTGGASAVYGSDAIAGVVNFITKKNFEGIQLDAQLGGNWHHNHSDFARQRQIDDGQTPLTGTTWDGRTINVNLMAGANILEGRGNITGYIGYQSMDPVLSTQRDFGGCQLAFLDSLDDAFCQGSSNSNFFSSTNALLNPEGEVYSVSGDQFVPRGSVATSPPAAFNSQPYIYMQRQDVRYNAGFIANVEVSDSFKPYVEFTFMDDRTHQEVAPTALFRQSNVLTDTGNYKINCSNPLLSAQQASYVCTPAEIAQDAISPGSVNADVDIGRRNIEGGARTYDYQHTNYRLVTGAKGSLAEGWSYDGYGQYYNTNFSSLNGRDFGFDKINNALQVRNGANGPECISDVARQQGCVPYNIFRDGGVTQEVLDYMETLGTATGSTELKTLHLDVTGDLGVHGIQLPTANEGVGVNVGYEYRRETISYQPDAAYESGLIVGTGGAYPAINNSLSVQEFFSEVRVPIMSERRGIYDLVADAGYRFSDYSTGVKTDTYKVNLQYAPIRDLRFRASFNHAIRAPSVVELYSPQLVGKIAFGEDPCARGEQTGVAAASLEQCVRTGVTPAQYGNGGTTNTIPQGTAGQLTQLTGGNPELRPEKGDTFTFGVTVQPESLPGFTGSLDYYRIKLEDTVGSLPAGVILSNCLSTGDPTYCTQLVRHPLTGTLNGASVQSGGYINQTSINIGADEISGLDLQAMYSWDLGLGRLRLLLNGAYLLSKDSTPVAGGGSYDCTGLFGDTCQTVNPKWRHNLRAAWELPSNLILAATWRFSSSVNLDNNDPNPLLYGVGGQLGAPIQFSARLPAVSYLDLSTTWAYTDHLKIRAGINNVFDKDPPLVPNEIIAGGAPNYYEFYDGLGRQVFAGVTLTF